MYFFTFLTALMWLLVYFEGKSVLCMLSNFISASCSSRRKQNCSLPACLHFILQHIWQHSQGWECGSRNLTLGSESTGKAAIGKQTPISRAKPLQAGDTSGVVWNWHKWLWTRRREERLEGKWKKCLLHISLSFPSACVLLLWALKQLQCSLPEGTVIQWRWRMIPTAQGFGSPLEWKGPQEDCFSHWLFH